MLYARRMDKKQALSLFGGTVTATARALEISPSAVSQWPDELTTRQENAVLGAAFKLGLLTQPPAAMREGETA